MHDVTNDAAPPNINHFFVHTNKIHSYETRSSAKNNLFSKFSWLNIQSQSFSRVGVRLWNQIPASIRNLSKSRLKNEIQQYLFSSLKTNGNYIDIQRLFQK